MPTVFRVIKPPRYKYDNFRMEALSALHEVERGMLKDFQSITDTWDTKPTFEHNISTKGGKFEVTVSTDDAVFAYLNDGVAEHDIYPNDPEHPLSFPWAGYDTYIPKTIPDWIGSFEAREEGDTVYKDHVHHPGVQARNFNRIIAKDWKARMNDLLSAALKKAVKDKA